VNHQLSIFTIHAGPVYGSRESRAQNLNLHLQRPQCGSVPFMPDGLTVTGRDQPRIVYRQALPGSRGYPVNSGSQNKRLWVSFALRAAFDILCTAPGLVYARL